jgi:hypothetical protein
MATWQWVVVAIACMGAGMVISRYVNPGSRRPGPDRKKDG